jgi:LacI family transcriptional regulator
MALGVLYAAHRLGRRVPDDLSVVGVDNMPESAHFWPPLTTVRQRLREAGALIVQEIDQLIKTEKASGQDYRPAALERTLLQPELIVRESSRPAQPSLGELGGGGAGAASDMTPGQAGAIVPQRMPE